MPEQIHTSNIRHTQKPESARKFTNITVSAAIFVTISIPALTEFAAGPLSLHIQENRLQFVRANTKKRMHNYTCTHVELKHKKRAQKLKVPKHNKLAIMFQCM